VSAVGGIICPWPGPASRYGLLVEFEDALSALDHLVGTEVVVAVAGADERPPVIFIWTGVLRAGLRDGFAGWIHGARWGNTAEVMYFGLDDSNGRGFYVSRRDFTGGHFEPHDGHDALALGLGNTILRIWASRPA
jgi:hypothetical protein